MHKRYLLGIGALSIFIAPLALAGSPPAAMIKSRPKSAALAAELGWIADSSKPCNGYFLEPDWARLLTPLPKDVLKVDADQTTFNIGVTSALQGHVTIQQNQRLLSAENVTLQHNRVTRELTSAYLQDKVSLQEPGKLMLAERAAIDFHSHSADLQQVSYRVAVASQHNTTHSAVPLTAWGQAHRLWEKNTQLMQLQQTTYSTCAPIHPAWQIQAQKLTLNKQSGRGYAQQAHLSVNNIPLLYVPYLDFPIDSRRQSGLLFPAYASSNITGMSLALPYYWNIAPNYDATITPRLFSKSGLQLNGELRYLTYQSSGILNTGLLPHDAAFAHFLRSAKRQFTTSPSLSTLDSSTTRSYISWQNATDFHPNWSSHIAFNSVSDDYYLANFGNIPGVSIDNQLLRQADLQYNDSHWNFLGRLQNFQTLHPVNQALISNQYSSLPLLSLRGDRLWQGVGWQLDSEYVHFKRQRNPGESSIPPAADRLMLQPGIALPKRYLSGFVIPQLQLNLTHYAVTHTGSQYAATTTRSLPIADIDSGLYLDRNTQFLDQAYQQTLEPRLFYLYVPYHQQSNIPLFDTALQPFNYDQLFSTNRFSGKDRVSDANQVSVAITTRLLNAQTGQEKIHASIGQAFYLHPRKVTLCATQDCQDVLTTIGSISPTAKVSPIVGQLNYTVNPAWNMLTEIAWDPHNRQTNNGSLNFQYQPLTNHVMNIGYNFVRYADVVNGLPATSAKNNLNQATMSLSWPLKEHWHVLGSWNYNVSHQHPQTYFYGAQYDSCCWAVRLVAGRTFTALTPNNTPVFDHTIYLQWQLKGLGSLGSSELTHLLQNSIPGYRDNFG